jgi:hypothetical protein
MERKTTMIRKKAVWGARIVLALFAGAVLLVSTSCGDAVRAGQGSSFLVISTLQGGPGDTGTLGSTLASDVLEDDGGFFGDRGQATFTLQMKDPVVSPSPNNSITLTQYHVEYVRADGRNTPGVDVPFPFDSGLTLTISGSGSTGFTLVRNQAKLEAPLTALRFGGGAKIISTIARVTFYGRDQTGHEVSVTGNIEVNFADWAG